MTSSQSLNGSFERGEAYGMRTQHSITTGFVIRDDEPGNITV